jgi:hypothetical protein
LRPERDLREQQLLDARLRYLRAAMIGRVLMSGALVACSNGGAPDIPACASSTFAADAGGATASTTIAMKVTQTTSDGTMRMSVPIRIGDSAPFDAFLDTGSSGLRVLEGAAPDASYACATTTSVTYSFHSGLRIDGVVAYATVTIGSLATPAPIPVMLVENTTSTFFGPYKAILGVGMRNGASSGGVANPIAELAGAPAFIVRAPAYGGSSGELVVAPSPDALATFATFQLPPYAGAALPNGVATWDDRHGLPACLNAYCFGAELDTGNPPIYVEAADATTTSLLAAGTHVEVTIGGASTLAQYSFDVASPATPGVDEVVVEPATAQPFMNLGTSVFFHYDVLFDQQRGVVGFAPK